MPPRIVLLVALALPGVAGAQTLQPGSWKTTSRMNVKAMPGVPTDSLAAMNSRQIVNTTCLTAADIAAGPRKMVDGSEGKCRYSNFKMSGGIIDATATCADDGGGQITTRMLGSYTPTTYTVRADMTSTKGMKMGVVTQARHVGACQK